MTSTIQSRFVVKRFLLFKIPLALIVGLIIFYIYHFMLLNSDGYWLLAPEAEKQWGYYTNKTKQYTAGIFNLTTDALAAVKSEALITIR